MITAYDAWLQHNPTDPQLGDVDIYGCPVCEEPTRIQAGDPPPSHCFTCGADGRWLAWLGTETNTYWSAA